MAILGNSVKVQFNSLVAPFDAAIVFLTIAMGVQFNSLVAPFDAAIVFLTIAMGVIWTYWGENKGESATLSAKPETALLLLEENSEESATPSAVIPKL
ncbi:hypothetical protein T484DRAFT_1818419 [Baffinella frigidus]|nr:hypothetical protein T484DRAFT_1818419 [Cryptophyta sp. CCMP2293]